MYIMSINNNTITKNQIFFSIVWMVIIMPIKGFLNPLSFLDSSFSIKFDNHKMIISKTIVNKLIHMRY
jgi:hypothetical protein